MLIIYKNGSFKGPIDLSSINPEKVVNSIITAESTGMPFKGSAKEMAEDVLSNLHLRLIPVVYGSWSRSDKNGEFTYKVIFQAVQGF